MFGTLTAKKIRCYNTRQWIIDFADVAIINDNTDSYKPHYTLKAQNNLNGFGRKYDYSNYKYTTSFFVSSLDKLDDELERFYKCYSIFN